MEKLCGGGMAARPLGCSSSVGTRNFSSFVLIARQISFPAWPSLRLRPPRISFNACRAKKKKKSSSFEAVIEEFAAREVEEVEEVLTEEEEEEDAPFMDEFGDDIDLEEDFEVDDSECALGDGAAGGGISLAGTWWDKEALAIAEDVAKTFDGDLKLYAFKTYANSVIRVRIEKLSSKYGSPTMTDIEEFSSAYQTRLDEAEDAGTTPQNITLEVSSPGVERVVHIPADLERFKDRAMYVKYSKVVVDTNSSQESDGVLKLVDFSIEAGYCIWALADVRVNREKVGKGRPLSKKQKEWELQTPFDSLLLVRLYSEC